MPSFDILPADLALPAHRDAVLVLIDAYARDPMGGGKPLPAEAQARLLDGLAAHPTTRILLAFSDGTPAGIAVCFLGFSTFAAKPLLNIHDFAVTPAFRGQGLGKALMAAVDALAVSLGCCKLTLEVLENNHRALGVYRAHGFDGGFLGERTLFLAKKLA